MILLAIDPGLRYPAAAVFKDGILLAASRVKVPGANHKLPVGQRCLEVARLIRAWVSQYGAPGELVIEWPRVRGRGSKNDPAGLFPLAGIGCALAGLLFADNPNLIVISPEPTEWLGGNTSKSTTGDPWASTRGYRAKKRLTQEEFTKVVATHDSVDATCIGLWRLGRFEAIKSFIGAS